MPPGFSLSGLLHSMDVIGVFVLFGSYLPIMMEEEMMTEECFSFITHYPNKVP